MKLTTFIDRDLKVSIQLVFPASGKEPPKAIAIEKEDVSIQLVFPASGKVRGLKTPPPEHSTKDFDRSIF